MPDLRWHYAPHALWFRLDTASHQSHMGESMAKTAAAQQNYLPKVQSQYENYPYPPCDPEKEHHSFSGTHIDALPVINHLCYGGRRDYSRPARALVAGGGTGNSTICLAEQLQAGGGEVVYLDLSSASMAIAQRRAEIRGLQNITFHQASLLDAPGMALGEFDIISCTGVLHHLQDPDAGLAALAQLLKDDGVMALMLYATYGRMPVYLIQEAMRKLAPDEDDTTRVRLCRTLLESLPNWHIFRQYAKNFPQEFMHSDNALYDLFLHSQDRAYTVPELYTMLEKQQLQLHAFAEGSAAYSPVSDPHGPTIYEPTSYIRDAELLARVQALPESEQYALAERMHGQMTKHSFYAAPFQRPAMLTPADSAVAIPSLHPLFGDADLAGLRQAVATTPADKRVNMALRQQQVPVVPSPWLAALLERMDGNTTLDGMVDAVMQGASSLSPQPTREALLNTFAEFYEAMRRYHWVVFRHKDVPLLPNYHALHAATQRRNLVRKKGLH